MLEMIEQLMAERDKLSQKMMVLNRKLVKKTIEENFDLFLDNKKDLFREIKVNDDDEDILISFYFDPSGRDQTRVLVLEACPVLDLRKTSLLVHELEIVVHSCGLRAIADKMEQINEKLKKIANQSYTEETIATLKRIDELDMELDGKCD